MPYISAYVLGLNLKKIHINKINLKCNCPQVVMLDVRGIAQESVKVKLYIFERAMATMQNGHSMLLKRIFFLQSNTN